MPNILPETLREAVVRLVPGGESVTAIESIQGGGNNRVYRVDTLTRPFFLKWYFSSPHDPRDRLQSEWRFSEYVWSRGIRQIPQPICSDPTHRLGLYEFLNGRPLSGGELGEVEIAAAVEFLRDVNRDRQSSAAAELPLASEACFSIAEHAARIHGRLVQLREAAAEEPVGDVREFVEQRLIPAGERIQRELEVRASPELLTELPQTQRIISPSDFGFHNALRAADGHLKFFDFEYAGWDDPAKTACDFFLQVAVPVPFQFWNPFVESLSSFVGDDVARRADLLLPLYRVKWCCIILSSLLKTGRERRLFSGGAPRDEPKCLELADRMLLRTESDHADIQ